MVREKRGQRRDTPIWETPRIKRMLAQPVGTPMDLTREEALAIIDAHLAQPGDFDKKTAERVHRELRRTRRESGALVARQD